ncbi:MAG: ankyrin repeat domain-containing protein [Myxococcota bacterium]
MVTYEFSYESMKALKDDLTEDSYALFYDAVKAADPGDENIVFDDAAKTLKIHDYVGEDLYVYAPVLEKVLRDDIYTILKLFISKDKDGKDVSGTGRDQYKAIGKVDGWEEHKQEILDEARDGLRDREYQDPPDDAPGLDDHLSDQDNLQAIIDSNPVGISLGGSHEDMDRGQMMLDLLDAEGHGGIDLFFIEELHVKDQPLINRFITSPLGTALDGPLYERAKGFPDVVALLEKVRDLNAAIDEDDDKLKVFGINDAEAKTRDGMLKYENRVALMNEVAMRVIDQAREDNPGKKILTYVGAAHSNTHPGGVPGFSQLYGMTALKVEGGTLKSDTEDKRLRGMPSKEEIRKLEAAVKGVDVSSFASDDAMHDALQGRLQQIRFDSMKDALLHPERELRGAIEDAERFLTRAKQQDPVDAERVRALEQTISDKLDELETAQRDAKATLEAYIKANPALLKVKDSADRSLLHYAAITNNTDAIEEILKSDDSMLDEADENGNTPVHLVLEKRDFAGAAGRKQQADSQAAGLKHLIDAGADLDKQNTSGKTPLHYAALNGIDHAAEQLIDGGADTSLEDDRGWSAYQTCLASTKTGVEKIFYDKDKASPEFDMPDDPASIVDILMKATLAEKPELMPEIRKKYERMYADEALRPILEMAAIDAMQPRNPPAEGGVRIFAADAPNTGRLFAAPTWQTGGQGGYDEKANTFLMSGNPDKDPMEGTLIHEMTHMITRKMYGEETIPCPEGDDDALLRYKNAIVADVKLMNMMSITDEAEARIKDRICGRMDVYARRGGDLQLLQEFIVSVPQLIAEYGGDVVARYAPNLMAFFGNFAKDVADKAREDDDYKALRARIDNTALDDALHDDPPGLPTAPPTRLDSSKGDLDLDTLMARVKAELAMRFGEPTLPEGVSFAYDPSVYDFKDQDRDSFEAKLAAVRRGLAASLTPEMLAGEISGDKLRGLILETTGLVVSTPADQLEEATRGNSANWARDTRVDEVRRQIDEGKPVDYTQLAEAILIRAEDKAHAKFGATDRTATVEVNQKKHATLRKALARTLDAQLKKLPDDELALAMPGLIEQVSSDMLKPPHTGFTMKKRNLNQGHADHVSMDKKKLKRAWLDALKRI